MFYTNEQLLQIGFKSLGKNVLISNKASIYSPHLIEIGNNVRIDDFCILSPGSSLILGNYIHISCYASIIGKGRVFVEDFCGISGRVSIYSSNDDYTGLAMTNPMIPSSCRRVTDGDVYLKKHSIVGAGSIILPNSILHEGVSVSALSLINGECEAYSVYAGVPAKKIRNRLTKFLQYERLIDSN
jgi:dTDP-4-amino-4,6-dideoxy-D-glucose acyltransferase